MADDLPYDGPDLTAAELALGVLDGDERAAALRRVIADPAFARDVDDWRRRFAGLLEDYADVPAPDGFTLRLDSPQPVPRRRTWPFVATLGALAASLALFFVMRPVPPVVVAPAPAQMMVASLMMTDKSAAIPVVVDMTAGDMRISGPSPAPQGKAAQLWLIGGDGVPKPLGVLATSGPSHMALPGNMRPLLAGDPTLAISIEPMGGSPTGLPTGPVVASGKLSTT